MVPGSASIWFCENIFGQLWGSPGVGGHIGRFASEVSRGKSTKTPRVAKEMFKKMNVTKENWHQEGPWGAFGRGPCLPGIVQASSHGCNSQNAKSHDAKKDSSEKSRSLNFLIVCRQVAKTIQQNGPRRGISGYFGAPLGWGSHWKVCVRNFHGVKMQKTESHKGNVQKDEGLDAICISGLRAAS